MIDLALSALYIGVGLFLAFYVGRRRGREQTLDAAASLLVEAREEGVAEGAGLIQAIDLGHHCPADDECAIAAQRRVAAWQ